MTFEPQRVSLASFIDGARSSLTGAQPAIRILLIDDDVDVAAQVAGLLQRTWEVVVTIATTAGEAEGLTELTRDHPAARFDLVVLDVGLPDLDGIELCRRFRLRPSMHLVPIVMVSGHTQEQDIEAALDAGATDYVCKPVRPRELVARIRAALRDKRRRECDRDTHQELELATAGLKRTNATLQRLNSVDPLTQLPNRRQFNLVFVREWRRAARTNGHTAVVIADIDKFHAYNEHYGHVAGDQCLIKVAGALTSAAQRPTDVPARWGGEEFVYILPDTELAGARAVAERVRAAVAGLRIPHAASEAGPYVSVSVGVASMMPTLDRSAEELLSAADGAMFRAKSQGRNRVCEAIVPARTTWLASELVTR